MIDREKVMADLRKFINYPEPLSGTVKDALELLKEQEANKLTVRQVVYADSPKAYEAYRSVSGGTTRPIANGDDSYICDACGETVGWDEMECYGISPIRYKYCPECGRMVRWNGKAD